MLELTAYEGRPQFLRDFTGCPSHGPMRFSIRFFHRCIEIVCHGNPFSSRPRTLIRAHTSYVGHNYYRCRPHNISYNQWSDPKDLLLHNHQEAPYKCPKERINEGVNAWTNN